MQLSLIGIKWGGSSGQTEKEKMREPRASRRRQRVGKRSALLATRCIDCHNYMQRRSFVALARDPTSCNADVDTLALFHRC